MNKKLWLAASLRVLTRYKARTVLMCLGVALGVAGLVVSRTLGTGAEQEMLEKINRMFGPSSIMIRAGGPGAGDGPVTTLKIADLEAIEQRLDQVRAWDPMLVLGSREIRYEGQGRQFVVYGHSERAETVWSRGVTEGRYFTAGDLTSASRVALIGTRVAEALFGDRSPIGEQILIDSKPFRVEGVLEPVGIDPHGMDRDEDVHIPTTTAMRRLLNVDYIAMAKLVVHDPNSVEETAAEITEILRRRHGIVDGEPSDFALFTARFVRRMIARANRVLKVFVPMGAGLVLLVAGLVISSIMLIAVRERIPEIGLRRAVGATQGQIRCQFLFESIMVTVFSGLVGLVLAAGVLAFIGRRMQLTTTMTPESMVLGLSAALVVGVLSGALPARQAARLDPVDALR